ncbi:protein ADP-ribosyltransferase PARP3 [Telopea speciosissima]|uniref:protein ADP-ribosyltransferase PARP3 n=1 Tax=Telopea speciosissima TaxID=54955 RepID=UPI001CC4C598|nr:protein ADP-ribosyltransferase PARP3 [Telopea speciosissima]
MTQTIIVTIFNNIETITGLSAVEYAESTEKKGPERRAQAHTSSEEEKVGTRKHKTENKADHKNKKAKPESGDNGQPKGKQADDIAAEFEEFCKATREHLSIKQMQAILEANDQNPSDSDDAVVPQCQDALFYGPLERCPVCNGSFECNRFEYTCSGVSSEWSSCPYTTTVAPRKEEALKIPNELRNSPAFDLIKKYQEPGNRSHRTLIPKDKPFMGMTIALSGRLSRNHHHWKSEIEKHGGKVSNTVLGVTCLVVNPAERERGGSLKITEALERDIPVVREAWLVDSIEKQAPQPLEAYDVASDLTAYGKGIPWDKQDPSEEALESFSTELKLHGKRGVYKDTMLQERGGKIFEKDGILFNCALSLCDQRRGLNDYCIMQLIMVPENHLHLYYKKGRAGDDARAEEKLEEWDNVDNAVKEFTRIFEEVTGNEFEPWEREKKFQKKVAKLYPIDMDDGIDAQYGGLSLRKLGIAATHCKLEPFVANFMKVLCSQDIYKYALMEMGLDSPDIPTGMLTELHLKRCEEVLLNFIETVKSIKDTGPKADVIWWDFSNRWFTLMHSTRPFIFKDYEDIADHMASALETVRDINVASRIIGDMTGPTIDDPLSERYNKLGCSVVPVEKDSDDYRMVSTYLEKTYEPVQVGDIGYGISIDKVFSVETGACPYEEIKNLPNKVLLWCGTRSSNLLRHLHIGLLPAICSLPEPGYMFGKAIVCSDAAAEAARYGFTAVDRPEGFLILAVASLGDQIIEFKTPPEDTKTLEEKKMGVKGLGRKKTDETEHTIWKDDIKIPCGRLIPSGINESPLEYNEYAVYDPKQVSIRFVVGVKFEEKGVVMDTQE